MIAVIQRVISSSVMVDNQFTGKIDKGINILLGIAKNDSIKDIDSLIDKCVHLRMFPDSNNKMNLSVLDISGSALVISQFTLTANLSKGRRPSFEEAESSDKANELYETFVSNLSEKITVKTGVFGADMKVEINNDGPVTFILDSRKF